LPVLVDTAEEFAVPRLLLLRLLEAPPRFMLLLRLFVLLLAALVPALFVAADELFEALLRLADEPPVLDALRPAELLEPALRLAEEPPRLAVLAAAFLGAAFLVAAFFGAAFLAVAFFGAAFLGAAFLGAAFFGAVFLAVAFLGAAFFAAAFLGAAFLAADLEEDLEALLLDLEAAFEDLDVLPLPEDALPLEAELRLADDLEAPFLDALLEDLPPAPFDAAFLGAAFLVDFAIVNRI